VSIILYKCDVLGSHREHADCSLCVTRDPKYQCSWCNNQCVYNETCVYGHVNECPKPRIDMVKLTFITFQKKKTFYNFFFFWLPLDQTPEWSYRRWNTDNN
jgi:hypothetical protein